MSNNLSNTPLTQQQLEILKLFSRELDENDMLEIKRLIVKYLAEKVTSEVDSIWKARDWTEKDMESILNEHLRTPYNPKN
ncbi:MAG: hypothetical protein AAF655_25630 [Bacteroidota bacterium]